MPSTMLSALDTKKLHMYTISWIQIKCFNPLNSQNILKTQQHGDSLLISMRQEITLLVYAYSDDKIHIWPFNWDLTVPQSFILLPSLCLSLTSALKELRGLGEKWTCKTIIDMPKIITTIIKCPAILVNINWTNYLLRVLFHYSYPSYIINLKYKG